MENSSPAKQDLPNLQTDLIKELSILKPYAGVRQIGLEFVSIAIAIGVCLKSAEIFGALAPLTVALHALAIVWIASRQHALGVLLHEAVHYRLCKNRKLNDFIGEWLLAWPLQVSLNGYRQQHLKHHRCTGEDEDPDYIRMEGHKKYSFPKTRPQLALIMLKYLLGLYTLYDVREAQKQLVSVIPTHLKLKRAGLYAVTLAGSVYFNFWQELLLYWILPSTTLLLLSLYVRIVAEHAAVDNHGNILTRTRHVNPTLYERILLAPNNVNYHLDHHLYPSVPFYNLPVLHEHLLRDAVYKDKAQIVDGYVSGVLMGICLSSAS